MAARAGEPTGREFPNEYAETAAMTHKQENAPTNLIVGYYSKFQFLFVKFAGPAGADTDRRIIYPFGYTSNSAFSPGRGDPLVIENNVVTSQYLLSRWRQILLPDRP